MQRLVMGVAALILSASAAFAADVRLVVRSDGSKVISNVGARGSRSRGTDLIWLARQHDRPSIYDPLINKYAEFYDVDPVLIKAIIQVESGYDPATVSHKGARGLMQLMPDTAQRFAVTRLHDPEENIRAGVAYLAMLLRLFRNDLRRTLAAYNAGENAVFRYGGIPPYDETRHYIQKALTVYYGRPYGVIAVTKAPSGPAAQPNILRNGLKKSPLHARGR